MDKQSREVYAEYLRRIADNLDNIKQINNEYELAHRSGNWRRCVSEYVISWPSYGFRKRKLTVNINGHEVVPPITDRLPNDGQRYYVLDTLEDSMVEDYLFSDGDMDRALTRLGWHITRDEAEAYWSAVLESHFADYK